MKKSKIILWWIAIALSTMLVHYIIKGWNTKSLQDKIDNHSEITSETLKRGE